MRKSARRDFGDRADVPERVDQDQDEKKVCVFQDYYQSPDLYDSNFLEVVNELRFVG